MASSKATGPTIGLDIGTAFIKAVEMRPGRGAPQLSAIGIMPTPLNAFAGDVISDPAMLGAAIKSLLKENGFSAKSVVASVSGQANFLMRILPVPKMTEKELAESMRWEVERHVPFRPEDTIKDFKPLPPVNESPASQEMSVLLAVGQKQMIDNYASVLLFAGLTPSALDVEPLSLVRTIPLNVAREECVAVVNIGGAKTDIGVFDRGILAYPRTLPLAGNNLTRAVADTLGLPTEQAERLKVEFGEIPESRVSTASSFDTGGFGGFDLPELGAEPSAATAAAPDFGLETPFGAPATPPEPEEPAFGGFGAPADEEEEGQGGIAFRLDDEDEAAPAAGGFTFALDDDEPSPAPMTATPSPSAAFAPPPTQEPSPFRFDDEPAPPTAEVGTMAEGASVPIPVSEADHRRRQVSDALVPVFNDLSVEIRRTIEYYSNRSEGRPATRVYLSGGTARMRGLAHALEQDLGIPVHLADPSRMFSLSGKNVQPGYYAEVDPVIALAVGLGIRDLVPDPTPEASTRAAAKTAAKASRKG